MDHRQGLLEGGDGGPIVVSSQPERSRLIAILRHEVEGLEMPEDGPKLSDDVIDDFEEWIAMGAPDPRNSPPTSGEMASATSWESTVKRRKQWWSFQPIEDPQVPSPVRPRLVSCPECVIISIKRGKLGGVRVPHTPQPSIVEKVWNVL